MDNTRDILFREDGNGYGYTYTPLKNEKFYLWRYNDAIKDDCWDNFYLHHDYDNKYECPLWNTKFRRDVYGEKGGM